MSISKVVSHFCARVSWSPGAARGAKGGHLLALTSMKALWAGDQVKHIHRLFLLPQIAKQGNACHATVHRQHEKRDAASEK